MKTQPVAEQVRGRVIVIDDEPNILKTLSMGIGSIGFDVDSFANPVEAIDRVQDGDYAIAFIDLKMKPIDGMQVLKEIRDRSPHTTCVIITAHGSIDSAVEAIKAGAYDFFQKPFDLKELQVFTEKVLEHHRLTREVTDLRTRLQEYTAHEIITRDPVTRQQIELAKQVADSPLTVLIEGESGTGKELLAQAIHRWSGRAEKPFVKVNCVALTEGLLESELFGHAKGAFTGAIKDREGKFESADGGTLLLDEIGEVAQSIQVKLLRFLQHREFERVGENLTRKVDVRVLAATNRNLGDALKEGSFREDLYYRINAVRITLPPLRERPSDVLLLALHFLEKYRRAEGPRGISAGAQKLLLSYRWQGNIRELEHVVERASLLCKTQEIVEADLPSELQHQDASAGSMLSLEEAERRHIARVLRAAKDFEEAAAILEIDPATLWRKRKKFGM